MVKYSGGRLLEDPVIGLVKTRKSTEMMIRNQMVASSERLGFPYMFLNVRDTCPRPSTDT